MNLINSGVSIDGVDINVSWLDYLNSTAYFYAARAIRGRGAVPQHIAFCMDGNRRYAKQQQLEFGKGHVAGFRSMLQILNACYQLGVKTVTVYAFSIENFNRAPEESEALFDLVRTKLWGMVVDRNSLISQLDWKIKFPGRRELLDESVIERIDAIESLTANCEGMRVNICAPYTTRDDLAYALQNAAAAPSKLTCLRDFEQQRRLADAQPLDILVRTSGETRLSDFMVWEADSRCMFEFIPELWPAFTAWRLFLIVFKWQLRKEQRTKARISVMAMGAVPPRVTVSRK